MNKDAMFSAISLINIVIHELEATQELQEDTIQNLKLASTALMINMMMDD